MSLTKAEDDIIFEKYAISGTFSSASCSVVSKSSSVGGTSFAAKSKVTLKYKERNSHRTVVTVRDQLPTTYTASIGYRFVFIRVKNVFFFDRIFVISFVAKFEVIKSFANCSILWNI